jgi:hypothetical protein
MIVVNTHIRARNPEQLRAKFQASQSNWHSVSDKVASELRIVTVCEDKSYYYVHIGKWSKH